MKHPAGTYFMILLIAGLSSAALEPKPQPEPMDLEEYLGADDWFQAGIVMNSEGRYHEAEEAFARSIAIEPGNALSWLNLGTAQALLGEFNQAINSLGTSVRIDPKLALGFANLAEVCFRVGRFQESVPAYTTLLTLWPDNANALYKLGLSHLALHEAGKAQAEYLRLKIVDPELAEKLREVMVQSAAH